MQRHLPRSHRSPDTSCLQDVGSEHAEYDYEAGTTSTVRSWDYSRQPDPPHTRSAWCRVQHRLLTGCSLWMFPLEPRSRFTGGEARYPDEETITPKFESFLDELYSRQNELGSALMIAFAEMFHLDRRSLFPLPEASA